MVNGDGDDDESDGDGDNSPELLDPRSSVVPFVPGGRVAAAVAVHDAEGGRGGECYHEGHGEVVYDYGDLLFFVVVREDDGPVLPRVVAGELGALGAVHGGEVGAPHVRGVPAAFDVDEQDRLVGRARLGGRGRGWGRRRRRGRTSGEGGRVLAVRRCGVVPDVDMCTVIHIGGASLPAGAPGAVEQPRQVLLSGGDARDWLGDEVGDEGRNGWVDVERNQEQQAAAS